MAYRSVSTTDDRRVVTYRLGRRIATIGDLREPITISRSSRTTGVDPNVPDEDETGFQQNLEPYVDTFAAVRIGDKRVLEGTDYDENAIHLFWIRNDPQTQIEARDYISYDNDLYRILSVRPIGKLQDYLMIRCMYYARMDEARFTTGVVRDETPAPEPPAPTPPSPDNSSEIFWGEANNG